jgi:thiamine biosynthesis protein ThiS
MHEATITVVLNGQNREVPAGSTLRALIEHAGLAGQPVAAEVNRELIPFRLQPSRLLNPGDTIELVTLVGGG